MKMENLLSYLVFEVEKIISFIRLQILPSSLAIAGYANSGGWIVRWKIEQFWSFSILHILIYLFKLYSTICMYYFNFWALIESSIE